MSAATLGTLLLVAIVALAATCAVLVYIEHRRDRAWGAETDAPDADPEWLREVAELSESCTCDWLDMGLRCDYCVAACSAAGHLYTEDLTNGQHHHCGVIL